MTGWDTGVRGTTHGWDTNRAVSGVRGGSSGLLLWKPSLEGARVGPCSMGTETLSPRMTNEDDGYSA